MRPTHKAQRTFAERYARDKLWRARRGRLVALALGLGLVLCWALFASFVVRAIVPAAPEEPTTSAVPDSAPKEVSPPQKQKRLRVGPRDGPPPPLEVVDPKPMGSKTPIARSLDHVFVSEDEAFASEEEEDAETDPRTGLRVPKFWRPRTGGEDLIKEEMGKMRVDAKTGEPTIFLMIASYRDFQCRETVTSALSRAARPQRLRIAVVQQNAGDDVDCDAPATACELDPGQELCVYRDLIKVYRMDAAKATGPVYARHVGCRMYRGEAFAMQVDAHVQFTRDWDTSLIDQWASLRNEMAVLSTYLTDVQGSIRDDGRSKRATRPIMCNSAFEGQMPARYLRHGAQPEEEPAIKGSPMLQPFWAAGMSFSRGHFAWRVPYDCCLPMVFMGEEISIGIRAWTHGYDLYAPSASVVFHEYAQKSPRRRGVHTFWENRHRNDKSAESLKRLTALIGMAPDVDEFDRTDAEKYGLGLERPVSQFYKLFLVDVNTRTSRPLCKFVKTGLMHREFHDKHLRSDGHGIDYAGLLEFDTSAAIDNELNVNWRPHARLAIEKAMQKDEVGWLRNAVDVANRAELSVTDPELVQRAKNALESAARRDSPPIMHLPPGDRANPGRRRRRRR